MTDIDIIVLIDDDRSVGAWEVAHSHRASGTDQSCCQNRTTPQPRLQPLNGAADSCQCTALQLQCQR
jgi:hypothetical protein